MSLPSEVEVQILPSCLPFLCVCQAVYTLPCCFVSIVYGLTGLPFSDLSFLVCFTRVLPWPYSTHITIVLRTLCTSSWYFVSQTALLKIFEETIAVEVFKISHTVTSYDKFCVQNFQKSWKCADRKKSKCFSMVTLLVFYMVLFYFNLTPIKKRIIFFTASSKIKFYVILASIFRQCHQKCVPDRHMGT